MIDLNSIYPDMILEKKTLPDHTIIKLRFSNDKPGGMTMKITNDKDVFVKFDGGDYQYVADEKSMESLLVAICTLPIFIIKSMV